MLDLQDDLLLQQFQEFAPEGFRPLSLRRLRWVQDCVELRYQHYWDGRVHVVLVHMGEQCVIGEGDE